MRCRDLLDGHGAHADPPRGAVRADRQEDAQPGIAVRVARRLRDEELDRLPDRVPGRERPAFAGVRRRAPPDREPGGLRPGDERAIREDAFGIRCHGAGGRRGRPRLVRRSAEPRPRERSRRRGCRTPPPACRPGRTRRSGGSSPGDYRPPGREGHSDERRELAIDGISCSSRRCGGTGRHAWFRSTWAHARPRSSRGSGTLC